MNLFTKKKTEIKSGFGLGEPVLSGEKVFFPIYTWLIFIIRRADNGALIKKSQMGRQFWRIHDYATSKRQGEEVIRLLEIEEEAKNAKA